jgi:hypothetical protein
MREETSQWRDHIRIQTHPTKPYMGHWMEIYKKQETEYESCLQIHAGAGRTALHLQTLSSHPLQPSRT